MASLLVRNRRAADAESLLLELETDLNQRRATPANREVLQQSRELRTNIAAAAQSGSH